MSWLNIEASNGFHPFDSNSICFYQLRDDSPNDNQAPFFHLSYPEPTNERSINFSDLSILRGIPRPQEPPQDLSSQHKPDEQTPEWQCPATSTRKGLKCLAQLLVKMLKKKPLQQGEIVPLVEKMLCKGKQQDGGKQEKNVKRRIYDALNVMIAAGLLEKEDTEIKIKEHQASTAQAELEPMSLLEEIQTRVEKKKELLRGLTSKKKGLEYWLRRNKAKTSEERLKHLLFPLILVMKEDDSLWMHYVKDYILMKAKSLRTFGETDIIENMYNIQIGNEDTLSLQNHN